MSATAKAREFRLAHLPDKNVGMTSFNANIRAGLQKVAVADRATIVLDALGLDLPAERLAEMKAIAFLVGVLDVDGITEADLYEAGFSQFVVTGVRLVQGQPFDTCFSYHRALAKTFDHYKLVKGALVVAELEAVQDLHRKDRRVKKTYGDTRQWVLPMLLTVPVEGLKLKILLDDLLDR